MNMSRGVTDRVSLTAERRQSMIERINLEGGNTKHSAYYSRQYQPNNFVFTLLRSTRVFRAFLGELCENFDGLGLLEMASKSSTRA